MSKLKDILDCVSNKLKSPNRDCLARSLKNCHAKGLFSLIVVGEESGEFIRVFISANEIKPFDIQLHDHKYPIRLTPLGGVINHHMATRMYPPLQGNVLLPEYDYYSILEEGKGLEYVCDTYINCSDYVLPIGGIVELSDSDIHTVSCSAGSIWIVEELGRRSDHSKLFGIPFESDELYLKPSAQEILYHKNIVLNQISKLKIST